MAAVASQTKSPKISSADLSSQRNVLGMNQHKSKKLALAWVTVCIAIVIVSLLTRVSKPVNAITANADITKDWLKGEWQLDLTSPGFAASVLSHGMTFYTDGHVQVDNAVYRKYEIATEFGKTRLEYWIALETGQSQLIERDGNNLVLVASQFNGKSYVDVRTKFVRVK